MTLELATGTEKVGQNQHRFAAVPRLRKRAPQAGWSQNWSINEKGEKTTTVNGVDANGNPVTQITVTDSSGNIIKQTGPNIDFNNRVVSDTPTSSESPSPSASASPSATASENQSSSSSSSTAATPTPSPSPSASDIPKTDTSNTQSTPSGLSDTASSDDTAAHGIGTGVIVGIVIGILVLLALIAFLMRRWMIKRRQRKANARFSTWAPTPAVVQSSTSTSSPSSTSPAPLMNETNSFNRNNNYFTSPTQPIQAASLARPIITPNFASNNQPTTITTTITSPKESSSIASPSIGRNAAGFFVPPAALISQADLRGGDLSPTTNNNNKDTNSPDDASRSESRNIHHRLTINENIPAQGHAIKVVSSSPVPVQPRRISTDCYRPPVSSVVMDGRDSCVLESENLNLTTAQDYSNATTMASSQITNTRIYLTDDVISTKEEEEAKEEESDSMPSSTTAGSTSKSDCNTSATSVSRNSNDLGNVLGLESMLSELRKKKPLGLSVITEYSPSSDAFVRDSIISMDERAPSPLVSPTFPSPSTVSGVKQDSTSWKTPRSSTSTLSVHTSKTGRSRPPSNVSVVSRQAVPFEAAPMPRSALRVINRHSQDNRS